MLHKSLRCVVLLLSCTAIAFASPSEGRACWFTSCFGGQSTYKPVYYPTYATYVPAYAPTYAYAPQPQACCNPCQTCNDPCNACSTGGNSCGYAPQQAYYQPITTYQPVTALKPATGGCLSWCPLFGHCSGATATLQPQTSYYPQTAYMPTTSYQPYASCGYGSGYGGGCNSCGNTCGNSCSNSCGGGCGDASSGTTAASTSYYEPSQTQPSCSSCNAAAGSATYSSPSYSSSTSSPSYATVPQSGPTPSSVTAGQKTFDGGQSVNRIIIDPKPEVKSETTGPALNKQMSNPSDLPRITDPRERTASMPVLKSVNNMPNARTVSDVRPVANQAPLPHYVPDEDGWYTLPPR